MSQKSPSRHKFKILCDASSPDNGVSRHRREPASSSHRTLCDLSISQSQNRQSEQVPIDPGIHERKQLNNTHWGVIKKNIKERRVASRKARPSITSDTFEVLSTVAEPGSPNQSGPGHSRIPDDAKRVLQLPVDQSSTHPLSIAARTIPPLEEQLAKHRDGHFEWILAVNVPSEIKCRRDQSGTDDLKEVRKIYFGCNLLPEQPPGPNGSLDATTQSTGRYLLLVTSIEETKDVLEIFEDPVHNLDMALPEATPYQNTLLEVSDYSSVPAGNESIPESTSDNREDDSFVESHISRSPDDLVTRIEDSFEALDILEDQLEAFNKIARYSQLISPEKVIPAKQQLHRSKSTLATQISSVRFATPQPQRTSAKPDPTSLRVRPATEPRRTALRKATSMTLDSHKIRTEDRPIIQPSLKMSRIAEATNTPPQRLATKSSRQHMIPTFELPGDAVARQLKEKKEARLALQRATQPTAASLSRARSVKLPTRPTFELPGEAISRRKREEHQAQLRAQEEEDRKRREFKARPLPSHGLSATLPRETIASRARQNKAALTENFTQTYNLSKRPAMHTGSHSRPALSNTINQSHGRGRELTAETSSALQSSRATSTSTTSVSGTRSPLSIEDVQMQKLRGQEIYQRDNSWVDHRMREKSERETLAKIAREEAAERSRQKSREWAAKQGTKQARKRATVACLRDLVQ
ncbi:hypothetical protein F4777DRAFT_440700 [Nemania sp. FL0916]|nr:hypothetical protein F4777DRAFT_440700 [Nemania sp. FL0916]